MLKFSFLLGCRWLIEKRVVSVRDSLLGDIRMVVGGRPGGRAGGRAFAFIACSGSVFVLSSP